MGTRWLQIGCDFTYVAAIPTPVVFQVQPVESRKSPIECSLWVSEPTVAVRGYTDLYGNPCVRAVLPAGPVHAALRRRRPGPRRDRGRGRATRRSCAPDDLPDDVLIYTLPSRYCLPDMLGDEAWSRFGGLPHRLQPGAGDLRLRQRPPDVPVRQQRPAVHAPSDVNLSGFGVCRDFTHLAISFCRALNIPARYVFGYLPDMDVPPDPAPMDFAAWMEVWLGDRWWTFDPRNNRRRKGRILIGRGRDASDVAMVTTFGGPTAGVDDRPGPGSSRIAARRAPPSRRAAPTPPGPS